ncbi:MAG: hypothetical protein JWN89_587 [Parcubacteria group bacterium]|nr:hypothetical protein [Parcubacteria group bacterium]
MLGFSPSASAQTTKPAEYKMLAPIPQLQNSSGKADLNTFIPNLIKLTIGIAAALAVIQIVIGGFQYISSEAFGAKSAARSTITNAIIGLILAISAYTILYTINPKLVELNLNLEYVGSSEVLPSDVGGVGTTTDPNGASGGTGCSTCVTIDMSAVPQKGVAPQGTTNGACKYPGPCVVVPALAAKLITLNKLLRGKVTWQVTEMFPPTVTHKDPCHNNGTCVDATLTAVTTGRLLTFLTEIDRIFGGKFEYETCNQTRLTQLQNDIQLARFKDKFRCESTTVGGESVHIEL